MGQISHINLVLSNAAEFDKALAGSLRDGGDLKIISKSAATSEGRPIVMLTFTVELPDGSHARAQTVVSARIFVNAARAIVARHESELEDAPHGQNH